MGYGGHIFADGIATKGGDFQGFYAHTSWHSATGLENFAHSVGCRGWFPAVYPTTAEGGPGWWLLLSREGGMPGCNGAVESLSFLPDIVKAVLPAVAAHRSAAAATFEVRDETVACKRSDARTHTYCTCPDFDGMKCHLGELCMGGALSATACAPPKTTFYAESVAMCAKCGGDGGGDGAKGDGDGDGAKGDGDGDGAKVDSDGDGGTVYVDVAATPTPSPTAQATPPPSLTAQEELSASDALARSCVVGAISMALALGYSVEGAF